MAFNHKDCLPSEFILYQFTTIPTQSFRTVSVSNHSTHDSHSQLPSKYDP